jgi:hypothetical protein
MSHHFDTPTAEEDPRINVCDFYLFRGHPGVTVMAMTVNPNAGISAPDTFRDEGLYAFRFDLNGDDREEVTFKIQFGDVAHLDSDELHHVQSLKVRRATGQNALRGDDGELIMEGYTGQIIGSDAGLRVYAGLAPDLFAGDGVALEDFLAALHKENRFDPGAFLNRKNLLAKQNVTAIVLEVPSHLIGRGLVRGWATVSLYGHAPELQVSRWGLPLITHLFLSDPMRKDQREAYNRAVPADDLPRFSPQIVEFVEKVTTLAGSAANRADYGKRLIARLCPTMLPYELGTVAAFDCVGFNGRKLTDDVMDVMLSLATNTALGDGVSPDKSRTRVEFPYFGEPYSTAEQVGVHPGPRLPKK